MRPGFISFTFFMTAFTGVTHLGAKELFRQWRDSNFADEHQNCPENHCHKAIFFFVIRFTPSYHDTEAECAHDNHADVYGGVLDKLDTDPFEEKDVLAEPWMAAEAQKPKTFRIAAFYAQIFSGRSARIRFSRHIKKHVVLSHDISKKCVTLSRH